MIFYLAYNEVESVVTEKLSVTLEKTLKITASANYCLFLINNIVNY